MPLPYFEAAFGYKHRPSALFSRSPNIRMAAQLAAWAKPMELAAKLQQSRGHVRTTSAPAVPSSPAMLTEVTTTRSATPVAPPAENAQLSETEITVTRVGHVRRPSAPPAFGPRENDEPRAQPTGVGSEELSDTINKIQSVRSLLSGMFGKQSTLRTSTTIKGPLEFPAFMDDSSCEDVRGTSPTSSDVSRVCLGGSRPQA